VEDFSGPSKADPHEPTAVFGAGISIGLDEYLLAPEDEGWCLFGAPGVETPYLFSVISQSSWSSSSAVFRVVRAKIPPLAFSPGIGHPSLPAPGELLDWTSRPEIGCAFRARRDKTAFPRVNPGLRLAPFIRHNGAEA
jgi:hypothetical protein